MRRSILKGGEWIKGGMLVAAMVGLDNRATMDMDTTLKNLPLTPEAIRSTLDNICNSPFDDGVSFEIGTILPIREDDIYGGIPCYAEGTV